MTIKDPKAETWRQAADDMLVRIDNTLETVTSGFPHWADATTGRWTTTPDGDWTGGAWPGMLWLAYLRTGDERYHAGARRWCEMLRPRATRETAFKGFGFYYGAVFGDLLFQDKDAAALALVAAKSLKDQFDPRLGLIPLGKEAEESEEVSHAHSSIDSLQAIPLLFWAAGKTNDPSYDERAIAHATRVLDIHMRPDGSIVQSSALDPDDGRVLRHFTHKGFADDSVWGRAQSWGMIYSAIAFARHPEQRQFLDRAMAAADWWLANVPASMIAYWDFNDTAIPDTEVDTAATAMVCCALLKLGALAPTPELRARYADAGRRTAAALVGGYLTPVAAGETRPRGMMVGVCFNKRPDARSHDLAASAETIFGSYYLFEALNILTGLIKPQDI